MKTRMFAMLAALMLIVVAGCATQRARPTSEVKRSDKAPASAQRRIAAADIPGATNSTHVLLGGGTRATEVRGNQLELSADVASTSVSAAHGLSVRVSLKNVGGSPVHWNSLRLGFAAVAPGASTGFPAFYRGFFANPSENLSLGPPLTLAPGETTSTVLSASGMALGVYRVIGEYGGDSPRFRVDFTDEIPVRVTSP